MNLDLVNLGTMVWLVNPIVDEFIKCTPGFPYKVWSMEEHKTFFTIVDDKGKFVEFSAEAFQQHFSELNPNTESKIEALYQQYLKLSELDENVMSNVQRAETRRSFYAGASLLSMTFFETATLGDTKLLFDEINSYVNEFKRHYEKEKS